MNRNPNYNKKFILETKNETKWLFFLSSSNHILYRKLEEKNTSQNNMLDSQLVKDFYATIDEKEIIRILAYTFSRQLIYYELIGKRWKRQILDRIYSKFQNISYFSILSSSNNIHILYYIESSLVKSTEYLVHYYLQEGKWYGGRLWKFTSDETVIPRTAFVDLKDNIHIIFTKHKEKENLALFHALFHSNSLLWTEPTFIHATNNPCNQFQLYTDENETIHLVWVENMENIYYLKYLHQSKNNPPIWTETTLHQSNNKISSPTFVQDDGLMCIWKENNILHQVASLDSGKTWGKAYAVIENSNEQFSLLHFISCNKNKAPFHSINIWGQEYPDIKIAAIKPSETKISNSLIHQLQSNNGNTAKDIKSTAYSINEEINREIKHNKNQIANLSSQINEIYSAIYELQEHLKLKEKSIFAIQAEIRRLGAEIRKIYKRFRLSTHNIESTKKVVSEPSKVDNTNNKNINDPTENEIKDKQSSEKNKEPEKITLGNTTILINPEDSEV